MRTLLINPPFVRLMKLDGGKRFPLGLGYLAAVLAERGFDVSIYNAENTKEDEAVTLKGYKQWFNNYHSYVDALKDGKHHVWQEIRHALERESPDVVGITTVTVSLAASKVIARLAKEINRNVKVVMGGAHPSVMPEDVLKDKNIDFVVRGEGEGPFLELVENLSAKGRAFDDIKGLSYRSNGGFVHNEDHLPMEEINSIPFPRRDKILNVQGYSQKAFASMMSDMLGARGCPFDCAFCGTHNVWHRRVRYRSPENITGEIEMLKKDYGARDIYFWEDSFTVNRKRVLNLCNMIIQKRFEINWSCSTRMDLLDDELLDNMRESGCNMLYLGVETGSDRMLSYLNKGITVADIERAAKLLKKKAMPWTAFIMLGFPDEEEDDIRKTFDILGRLNATQILFSVFTPYPGTKLFERSKELGFIPQDVDWSLYSTKSPYNCFVKNISKERFMRYLQRLIRKIDSYNSRVSLKFLKLIDLLIGLLKPKK